MNQGNCDTVGSRGKRQRSAMEEWVSVTDMVWEETLSYYVKKEKRCIEDVSRRSWAFALESLR